MNVAATVVQSWTEVAINTEWMDYNLIWAENSALNYKWWPSLLNALHLLFILSIYCLRFITNYKLNINLRVIYLYFCAICEDRIIINIKNDFYINSRFFLCRSEDIDGDDQQLFQSN